ncbi:hypothetical protein LMH87_007280 [Akanthomyces muscarius]|uniref:Cell wall protein n=1 Tax=Akanthomyces muscarius TaxID=2231603 RepID=A0A9W8US97_AKAMU|nr:hypothetical protein LMH87_007280 [Akanthomyces muscarius]KAJ4165656.1 hypothetical protein LMH87_007280 [Akanthomyces muscarius]
MHFVASLVAVGSIASLASASAGFEFPAAVPLSKRQTSGPAYNCHANCGYAIQDSAKDGYCEDSKWKDLLSGCLDCAMTYDIWKYYGDKVGAAAKKCGLDATPKAAAASGSASTSEAPKTTAAQSSAPASSAPATQPSASGHPSQPATAPQTSHASGSSQVPSTSAAGSHSSGAATTGVATTAKPTTGTSHTAGNNTTSTPVQVGAAYIQKPAMLAAGAVAVFAVNMI